MPRTPSKVRRAQIAEALTALSGDPRKRDVAETIVHLVFDYPEDVDAELAAARAALPESLRDLPLDEAIAKLQS